MGLDCPSFGSPLRCLLRIVLSARVLTLERPGMRSFLSVSGCTFDVEFGGGAGRLILVRSSFAISVEAKLEGLNCSTFGSPLRSQSRLVLSASCLISGLPCRGKLFMAALSRATSVGVVGIRGLVGSLLSVGSEFSLLLSNGLGSQETGEG